MKPKKSLRKMKGKNGILLLFSSFFFFSNFYFLEENKRRNWKIKKKENDHQIILCEIKSKISLWIKKKVKFDPQIFEFTENIFSITYKKL